MNIKVETSVWDFIKKQLSEDLYNMTQGTAVSLCAKWLPSANTSSMKTRKLANLTIKALGWTPRHYRKTLSALRAYINVVEVKMCAKEWDDIDYEKVPSKATLTYKKAFKKHDEVGWTNYLGKVESGEAKINAKALYPYEIVRSVWSEEDETAIKVLDLQWLNQTDWLVNNPHKGLVIADVSGSMTCNKRLPLMVSISLAIYFAERNTGPFQNCFLTFTDDSKLERVVGSNIKEKVHNLNKAEWGGSTNLQSAFDTILDTAIKNKVSQQDLPSHLYVVTDGEFNYMCSNSGEYKTNCDFLKEKFKSAGYILPKIVWWNVNCRNDHFPITQDETGMCLVSGCSPSILKSVLSGKDFNPMAILEETISQGRYDRVVV